MAGNFTNRFAPIEIVLKLRTRLLFVRHHFGFHHGLLPEKRPELGAGAGVITHPLGKDVARTRQRRGYVRHAFFWTHIFGRLGGRIKSGLLLEHQIRQRFQTLFLGNHRAGAALGAERLVNILKLRHGIRLRYRLLEFIGQEVPFRQRFENAVTALIQLRETHQPFADAGDGDFIQRTGDLLAIAGDERHRGSFGEQLRRGENLARRELEFAGDFKDVRFVHAKGQMVYRSGYAL